MFAKLLGKIIGGPAAEKAVEYFNEKQKLKQELKLAKLNGKIALERAREDNSAAWAQAHIANSGWKDEYVLVILSIPLVLVFIPGTSQYILQGFQVLEQTPEWYRWLIVSVMAAIYGIKPAWDRWKSG